MEKEFNNNNNTIQYNVSIHKYIFVVVWVV